MRHLRRFLILAVILRGLAGEARAHGGRAHLSDNPWIDWTWPPLVLANVAVVSLLYLAGWWRIRHRSGKDLGLGSREYASFAASMVIIVFALASPIDTLSDYLQSMHMVQHTLLMMVAAPLFVLGCPAYVILLGLPRRLRRFIGRYFRVLPFLSRPSGTLARGLVAFGAYAVTLWLWHVPALYEATLGNELLHDFAHVCFFVSSCFLWWIIFHPLERSRLDYGAGILYLFVTSLHSCALGALTALSPSVLYPSYLATSAFFGLTPLEDQQIAGYIMWMPAGMSYIVAAAFLLGLWLKRSEGAFSRQLRP